MARRSWAVHIVVACAVAAAVLSVSARADSIVLLGDQTLYAGVDSNTAGNAEAFRTTAVASGTLASITVYIDSTSAATSAVAGIYATSGAHPGALLTQGTLTTLARGSWNTISVTPTSVTAGTTYWIALLGRGGTIRFRDRLCGCASPSETSAQNTLTTLPASWTTGANYADAPISAYGSSSPATEPVLAVSPASVSFAGSVGGADPAPAALSVTNTGIGTLSFTASSDQPWLSVSPGSGTAPQTLTVGASISDLSAGTYTGNVTVSAPGVQGSPKVVPVTLTLSSGSSPSDWLTVDHDPARSGQAGSETAISPTTASSLSLSWSSVVDGKVTAQPLFAKGAQVLGQTRDVVVAATSANSVYALDASNGATLWRRNFGAQSPNCAVPGGFGISGAPVIDRSAGRVYAVSEDGNLRTLHLSDGSDAAPALPLISAPATNKVWGGLNLVGSSLYVATASDGCDTPPWRGQIYRVDVSGATPRLVTAWAVVPGIPPPNGGGGIWGYGGVSADPATGRVYAATAADSNELYQPYGDRMVALDGALNVLGSFEPFHPGGVPCTGAPCDVDFGATPIVFQPSGCGPLVAAGNKDGNLYLLREGDLAASLPPLQTLRLNIAHDWLGTGGVGGVPAYWSAGRMLFVTDAGAGIPGVSAGVVALTVRTDCTLQVAWSAPLGGNTQPNSTPTIANGVVFVGEGNGGRVHAYDAVTGAHLWDSGAQSGGALYAAPIVADGKLITGSWNGFGASDTGTIRAFEPAPISVAISGPPAGSTVSGPQTVTAATTGAVTGVQFLLDGANLGAEDTSSPWSVVWDTTTASNGTHTLSARARDAAGHVVTSGGVVVTVQNGGPGVFLLGDQSLDPGVDSNVPGNAEAFRTTATAGGTLAKLVVYVDAGSTATSLVVGVYTDSGGHPRTLLSQATSAAPVRGAWNTVTLPAAGVSAGATYWIAVLAPAGTIRFRDRACGCANPSETSAQNTLTTLPATWTTGVIYQDAPLSAYATS